MHDVIGINLKYDITDNDDNEMHDVIYVNLYRTKS